MAISDSVVAFLQSKLAADTTCGKKNNIVAKVSPLSIFMLFS
jgi:hypothetical protein